MKKFYGIIIVALLHSNLTARSIKQPFPSNTSHQSSDDEMTFLSDSFHVVLRLTDPWTPQQLQALETFFGVADILNPDTILNILLYQSNKCGVLYAQPHGLFNVFVTIIKYKLLPGAQHIITHIPPLLMYSLYALLLAGANPQPPVFLAWPSLQWYIGAGTNYLESLALLFQFGAKPDFIAGDGQCTAMVFNLGQFWSDGAAATEILLQAGADLTMLCPKNNYPKFLMSNAFPRKTYFGYFIGYTPVDIAIISFIEQCYFAFVYDPHPKEFNREAFRIICQKNIDILTAWQGKASSKSRLKAKLLDLVSKLDYYFNQSSTHQLDGLIDVYVAIYGT